MLRSRLTMLVQLRSSLRARVLFLLFALASGHGAAQDNTPADDAARRQQEERATQAALDSIRSLPLTASDEDLAAVATKLAAFARNARPEALREVRVTFEKQRQLIVAAREQARIEAEDGAQRKREQEDVEQRQHAAVLARIAALTPETATADQAKIAGEVDAYERTAPARYRGVARAKLEAWRTAEQQRRDAEAARNAKAIAAPRPAPPPLPASVATTPLARANAREAALQAARAAGAPGVFDTSAKTTFGVPAVLFAEPALRVADSFVRYPTSGSLLVVDLARLYDNDPETLTFNASLEKDNVAAQQIVQNWNDEGNALVAQYKTFLENSTKSSLSAAERSTARAQAEAKLAQVQAKKAEIDRFVADTRAQLQRKLTDFRDAKLAELTRRVADRARTAGVALVFEKVGPSLHGIAPLIYADPLFDCTDALLTGRPIGTTRAAGRLAALNIARVYERHFKTIEFNTKIARDQAIAQAELSKLQAEGKTDEAATFGKQTTDSLQQRAQAFRALMLEEIGHTAADVAKRRGISIVYDNSALSLGTESDNYFVLADPKSDLTNEVLAAIAALRPTN